jgi:hypothetical protein
MAKDPEDPGTDDMPFVMKLKAPVGMNVIVEGDPMHLRGPRAKLSEDTMEAMSKLVEQHPEVALMLGLHYTPSDDKRKSDFIHTCVSSAKDYNPTAEELRRFLNLAISSLVAMYKQLNEPGYGALGRIVKR